MHCRVPGGVAREADVLDIHTLDVVDLGHEQVDQVRGGKLDRQVVHRPTRATFDDLDAHEVTAHRADPRCHRTQGTGTVRHPYPQHHGRVIAEGLRTIC